MLGQLGLTDELVERSVAETGVLDLLGRRRARIDRPRDALVGADTAPADRLLPSASGPRAGPRASSAAGQLAQRDPHHLLHRHRHPRRPAPPDLVGAVAELGQGRPDLTARRHRAAVGRRPSAPRVGRSRRALSSSSRRAAVFFPTPGPGTGCRRRPRERRWRVRPGTATTGSPGPTPARRRVRPGALRSTGAHRHGRSRTGRWRPHAHGCAHGEHRRARAPRAPPGTAGTETR